MANPQTPASVLEDGQFPTFGGEKSGGMSAQLRAHLALLIVAFVYGGNYIVAKVALDGYLHPFPFILLRATTAVLLFWMVRRSWRWEIVEQNDLFRLALCGLFGVAMNQLFFFSGLKLTSPINASLLMTTTPILVLVISALLIGERITWQKVLGIALGAGGAVLLIAYGRKVNFGGPGMVGDILVFINASAYGVYLVLVKKLMAKYQAITVITWVFTFGWLLVLPFGLPGLLQTDFQAFTPAVWWSVVYVLLLTTFLVYLLNAWALRFVNPSVVSIYIYLQPLIAGFISVSLGQEQLTGIKIFSALCIFAGVYLVSFAGRTGLSSARGSGR